MSNSFVFNKVYDEVRSLGLPYEIQESGGNVMIKISSSSSINQKQSFKNSKEKFRFLTSRTLNGSRQPNWRVPPSSNENSYAVIRKSFPDIEFFRRTPPPNHVAPPSPLSLAPTTPPPPPTLKNLTQEPNPSPIANVVNSGAPALPSSTSLESPPESFSKPMQELKPYLYNPYRCLKRQIVFPRTPNLLDPSSVQPSFSNSSTTSVTLDMSEAASDKEEYKYEALEAVMKAIYEQRHF